MLDRPLGTTDVRVSALGLGCNNFGVRTDLPAARNIVARGARCRHHLLRHRRRLRHCAADRKQSSAKCSAPRRKDIFLVSKFGVAMDDEGKLKGGSARYVTSAIEASLKRLKTDWIDLYYYHRPDPATPIEETLRALDALIAQGKVRYIGCSNMTAAQLAESQRIARENGLHRFIVAQDQYNLLSRQIETDLIPAMQAQRLALMPYFPLASGMLTGKYAAGAPIPAGSRMIPQTLLGPLLQRREFSHRREAACVLRRARPLADRAGLRLAVVKASRRLCDSGGKRAGASSSERSGNRLAVERRRNGGSRSSVDQAEGSIVKR